MKRNSSPVHRIKATHNVIAGVNAYANIPLREIDVSVIHNAETYCRVPA